MESQSAMQGWPFSAESSSNFTTHTLRQGQARHPDPFSSNPWSWDSQLPFLKLTPDQQEANCHHLFVFLYFSYQDCWKDFNFEMSQMCKKENFIYLLFFSVSEMWLFWMSVPKCSVAYEKWSLLFSECLMMLKEDKLPLNHRKKGDRNISTDCIN